MRQIAPFRDAVELMIELIEDRGKRRNFSECWDEGGKGAVANGVNLSVTLNQEML